MVPRVVADVVPALGLPCVLKQPDSAFSMGVVKVASEAELALKVDEFLAGSELIIAIDEDPGAAIFGIADYGVVADLFDVADELTDRLA